MNEDRIAKLEAEVARLKAELDPPPQKPMRGPSDRTAGLRLPRSVAEEMARVDTSGLARDFGRGVAAPSGMGRPQSQSQLMDTPSAQAGWYEPKPLGPQPGAELVDRVAAAFDARERKRGAL